MQSNLYHEYALLDLEFKKLEDKREDLRSRILQDMIKDNHKKVETDFGQFTMGSKVTWIYTDKVKSLEERVKILKLNEQKRGKAKASEKPYLLYTEKKIL